MKSCPNGVSKDSSSKKSTQLEKTWTLGIFRENYAPFWCFLVLKQQKATSLRGRVRFFMKACKLPERRFRTLKFDVFDEMKEKGVTATF